MAHLGKLSIEAGCLAGCSLNRTDVGHLRADMKVYKLEAVSEPCRMEHVTRLNEVGRGESELGIFAAARRPLSGPFGKQAHAQPDHRLDRHFL